MQDRFFRLFGAVRLWRVRGTAGALMAKAVYEQLEHTEQTCLDHLLKQHPQLGAEQQKLASFAEKFSLATDDLPIDMSARISDALANGQAASFRQNRASLYAAGAAVAVLAIGLYLGVMVLDAPIASPPPGQTQPVTVAALKQPNAELKEAMDKACALVADNDVGSAASVIEQSVRTHPDTELSGEALLLLADIEYTYTQRYDRALNAYEELRTAHPAVFGSSSESMSRYNLLMEAKREGYAPLFTLDSARKRSFEGFATFENLIAAYPNTYLAAAAMEEMCTLVKKSRQDRVMTVADELEMVRDRCSNPVAIAQVDLTLGHVYCDNLNDRARARAFYNRVVASDHIALVNLAREALVRME